MKGFACGAAVVFLISSAACGKEESSDTKVATTKSGPASIQKKVEDKAEKIAPAAVGKGADASDFGVESAKIVFKVTGSEEGTVTAWIGDHGKTVVLFKDMKKRQALKQHIVWRNGETTIWKHDEKPHTTRFRAKDSELRLVSTLDPKQLEMAGYTKKPNETIAGKDCEVWHQEKMNVTLWRWQGIDLKYINGVAKKNPPIWEATEVVVPADIPADMIGPPQRKP